MKEVKLEKRCNMKRVQFEKVQLGKSATRNDYNT